MIDKELDDAMALIKEELFADMIRSLEVMNDDLKKTNES